MPLAHPFHINPRGGCATVDQGSDEQYDQMIRVHIGTRQGTREMVRDYGLLDPLWRGVFVEDVQAVCDTYGPPITITDIDTTLLLDESQQIRSVSWERGEQ